MGSGTSSVDASKALDGMRIISWNLLRRVGANMHDIAKLIRSYHPDLVLLQEATEDVTALLADVHLLRRGVTASAPSPTVVGSLPPCGGELGRRVPQSCGIPEWEQFPSVCS